MAVIEAMKAAALPGGLDRQQRDEVRAYVGLRLALLGIEVPDDGVSGSDRRMLSVVRDLLDDYREKNRLLDDYLCPVDQRIQRAIDTQLEPFAGGLRLRLPSQTLVLDRYGMARECSLPLGGDRYANDIIESYRVANGVLHNPRSDRRTTKGVFHICDCEFPVPADKVAIPPRAFAELLHRALHPPQALLELPYTSEVAPGTGVMLSLLLRPLVQPAVPGVVSERRLETRFFVPGSMAANLDFVENIFGNGGDPYLPSIDAALDPEHWTGHSGCVVLAPHLVGVSKKALGLPHIDDASERQREQGVYWSDPDEPYNDGQAFKATLRTRSGVMVTLIADNYFGYCKKEVKTQISFSANLMGMAEEEHAGGTLAFPSYNLAGEFKVDSAVELNGQTMATVHACLGDTVENRPEGHAVDRAWPSVVYVPDQSVASLESGEVSWSDDNGVKQSIRLLKDHVYVYPNGYKLRIARHPGAPSWRLVGTVGEGTFCHKPCTVSGGGKSEISKSLTDAVLYGSLYVHEVEQDLDLIDAILKKDYSERLRTDLRTGKPSRTLLSSDRSLGSVIKMFTPSQDFTDEYNQWLDSLPRYILPLVFIVKRFYRQEWGDDWRSHFGVDVVNGHYGHEFKLANRTLVASYLRMGLDAEARWRTCKLRQDFLPSDKVQMEDDISASVTVPVEDVPAARPAAAGAHSVKVVENCEFRLFQRPDEAVHRGYDIQAESDLAAANNFISNFQPLTRDEVSDLVENPVAFDRFSQPMQDMLSAAHRERAAYVVSSAHPRLVDGRPSKNPRYLQERPDVVRARDTYVARVGMRLARQVPADQPLVMTVDATLPGRRNNPADPDLGVPALAVYNPLHYQELPELFMDFICSVTGKSPSTTGFGSEGAMTKGPFNCLPFTADLNAALISAVLCGGSGFSTAAGYVGPNVKVDHDISLLIPELLARIPAAERDPERWIAEGYLEPLADYELDGDPVLASRLGYRITERFVSHFLGRVFDNPRSVFTREMLRPEEQDPQAFASGVRNIVASQQRVARQYIADGTLSGAIPPLQVLLSIMSEGHWQGKTLTDPEVRQMFTREAVLEASWYSQRLAHKQMGEVSYWRDAVRYLEHAVRERGSKGGGIDIGARLQRAHQRLAEVQSPGYLGHLRGTLGTDPLSFDA